MTAANLALAAGDVAVGAVWEGDYKVPVVLKNEDRTAERSLSDIGDTYVSSLVPGVSVPAGCAMVTFRAKRKVSCLGKTKQKGLFLKIMRLHRNHRICLRE